MITNVTIEELELHNSVYASIQLKHPNLSEAQLSWLNHTIWNFMVDEKDEFEMNYNTVYNLSNTYTTTILKNPLLADIYSNSKVKKHRNLIINRNNNSYKNYIESLN